MVGFFHIEQEKTKLRDDSTGWDKVANAINNTFTCSTLSVGQESFNNEIIIYPNPTTNSITVEGSNIKMNDIKIYNMLGQEISEFNIIIYEDQNKFKVNMTNLSSGIYILKIKTTTNKVVYKQ